MAHDSSIYRHKIISRRTSPSHRSEFPTGESKHISFTTCTQSSIHQATTDTSILPRLTGRPAQSWTNLLLSLEVVKEDGALLGLLTPVLNNDARAVDDLAGVTLTVKGAYSQASARQFQFHTRTVNSNIQRPTHSPSIFPSGTLMSGILCSEHRATTSFL